MFAIHIDDNQLNVYSLKISELILRAAVEIESLSKDLYTTITGTSSSHVTYDEIALKKLNQMWNLEEKVVIISSTNCYISNANRLIYPFVKTVQRTGRTKMTYGWNNAYQNIKHDRGKSLKFGSIKHLFEIMAALFVLNIYFKDETFDLKKDHTATAFPINLGSQIFSINLHTLMGYGSEKPYRNEDYNKSLYLFKKTDKALEIWHEANRRWMEETTIIYKNHPAFLKFIAEHNIKDYSDNFVHSIIRKILPGEIWVRLDDKPYEHIRRADNQVQYEAVLNKNIL